MAIAAFLEKIPNLRHGRTHASLETRRKPQKGFGHGNRDTEPILGMRKGLGFELVLPLG
jgi:hypothetical protein